MLDLESIHLPKLDRAAFRDGENERRQILVELKSREKQYFEVYVLLSRITYVHPRLLGHPHICSFIGHACRGSCEVVRVNGRTVLLQ